ncbi:disulfide bond formation protein B [Epibacterium sp. SM1969]|uniref:Disulfide bond formation protein B n=1 Tax=Tritonibacter aquimaris TaxID=2663379 RepID=A0A844AN29_9RHOB|nr:disulfide bond formation protein B [Tritonibacter aquimaris]
MSRILITIAACGSAALLLAALGFQHLGGLAPCKLCFWQRYPHAAAIVIGVIAVFVPVSALMWLGWLAVVAAGGVGVFHVGVEQGWWEGPTTCTSAPVTNLSPEQLMEQIMSAPLVRCDEIAWELFGISMAGWNVILSFTLALLWFAAARHNR